MKSQNHRLIQASVILMAILAYAASIAYAAPLVIDQVNKEAQTFSLKLRDSEITDVLRLLADEFGLNVVMGEGVSGLVTVDFKQVSLAEALNSILNSKGLNYVQEGNILRIEKKSVLEKESIQKSDMEKELKTLETKSRELEQKNAEADQKKAEAEKELLPLVTKTMQLNYINSNLKAEKDTTSIKDKVQDFQTILANMLSGRKRSNVSIVDKTNTLIVTDIEENANNILKMAKLLDVATPQIRIEARIVETNDRNQLAMGIQWGGKYSDGDLTVQGDATASGSTTGRSGNSFAVNLPAGAAPGLGGAIDFTLGKLGSKVLDINLSAMERADKLKVLSRPSILVMQNQSAEIHVGSEVPILKGFTTTSIATTSTGGALPTPDVEYRKIGIRLNITSQITSENSIFMAISVEKSDKGDPWTIQSQSYDSIATKNAYTQVVVNNKETVVIGGLYTTKTQTIDAGVPYFSKIPVLGWLFKYKKDDVRDEELMIFITPEIIPATALSEKNAVTIKTVPQVME